MMKNLDTEKFKTELTTENLKKSPAEKTIYDYLVKADIEYIHDRNTEELIDSLLKKQCAERNLEYTEENVKILAKTVAIKQIFELVKKYCNRYTDYNKAYDYKSAYAHIRVYQYVWKNEADFTVEILELPVKELRKRSTDFIKYYKKHYKECGLKRIPFSAYIDNTKNKIPEIIDTCFDLAEEKDYKGLAAFMINQKADVNRVLDHIFKISLDCKNLTIKYDKEFIYDFMNMYLK